MHLALGILKKGCTVAHGLKTITNIVFGIASLAPTSVHLAAMFFPHLNVVKAQKIK